MHTAKQPVYRHVADSISRMIAQGVLREGDRVPSVRTLSRDQEVSVATAVQAYVFLEQRGFLEARPRSGFFVRPPARSPLPEPSPAPVPGKPARLSMAELASEAYRKANNPDLVPLGAAAPGPDLLPSAKLNRLMRTLLRAHPNVSVELGSAEGVDSLRRQIARLALRFGCTFSPESIVVTLGTLEALHLALRVVAKPGDLVAVESPSFFCILQAMEQLGLRVLEIPTDPRHGMDLTCLQDALRHHKVAACITMSCCHNPLGYVTPEPRRRALAELAARHQLPIIEDDVWGDLTFGPRPKPIKAFDTEGLVLYCSSFSKSVAPGCRVGWIEAGRYTAEVRRLKSLSTGPTPVLPQRLLESFLASGSYERHLRALTARLDKQSEQYRDAIYQHFPPGTRVSRPEGGCFLWLQLPPGVDGEQLCAEALKHKISLMPGRAFSAGRSFSGCVRLSCGHPWSQRIRDAIIRLASLVMEQERKS